ncbi:MAG: glycosyltransferase family 4 protein [Thermoleophilaceae bacterium]
MPDRVLFLHSSAGLYGADLQLAALACGLRARGRRVTVALPERGELAGRLEAGGAEVAAVPLAVLRRRGLTPTGIAGLAADARAQRAALAELAADASIIHSNTSVVLGGGRAAAAADIPHVIHVREIYEGAAGWLGAAAWPVMRRRLMLADARICVSAAVAVQFDPAATHVVHDGVTRPGAPPRPRERDAPFTVAVLGRIADWKGQDVLAHALADPALADIGAVGLVAGDIYPGESDAPRRALQDLAARLALGDRLRLLGFTDAAGVIAAADVVVVPSIRPDPFPNSALEALAAGRPVVAAASGGLPEMIRDGETGLLVVPGDPAALARALRRLADDDELRTRMGAAAAADAAARFTVERMLDGVEAVYGEVAVRR